MIKVDNIINDTTCGEWLNNVYTLTLDEFMITDDLLHEVLINEYSRGKHSDTLTATWCGLETLGGYYD